MLSDTKLSIFNFPLNFAELLRLLGFKSNPIPLRILDQNECWKKIVSLKKEQMMNGTTGSWFLVEDVNHINDPWIDILENFMVLFVSVWCSPYCSCIHFMFSLLLQMYIINEKFSFSSIPFNHLDYSFSNKSSSSSSILKKLLDEL